jgi:uncharacterized membrane protein YphA (DoxX/SURF4 family)
LNPSATRRADQSGAAPSSAGTVIVWVLALLCGLFFLGHAYYKLSASEQMIAAFSVWGYSATFMVGIAVLEAVCGLALMVPRLSTWAAVLLSIEMLGAVYTILSTGIGMLVLPLVTLAVLAIVGWRRRPQALGLRG